MKRTSQFLGITLLLNMLTISTLQAQPSVGLQGAYEHQITVDGEAVTQLLLISDDYFSWTEYKTDGGDFIMTKGGKITYDKGQLKVNYEFNSSDKLKVGQTSMWSAKKKKKALQLDSGNGSIEKWVALETQNQKSPLQGAWLFSGRERNGTMTRKEADVPRKTMKLLTATHFQWIAYNTETGEFFGTGGGKYSATDGQYTENIAFFSRDNNRVGASLEFDFNVEGEDWHHKGLSSKGDPIYEVWSKRED